MTGDHTHSINGVLYRAGCPECRALNRNRMRRYLASSPERAEAHRESSRKSRRRARHPKESE